MQCDMARLIYVFHHGGFYCDTDCRLLAPLPPPSRSSSSPNVLHLFTERVVDASRLGPREKKTSERETRVANYLFGCDKPNHPLLWTAIEECARRLYYLLETEKVAASALRDSDVIWATGPDVLTSVYHDRPPGSVVALHPASTHRHYKANSWCTERPRGQS